MSNLCLLFLLVQTPTLSSTVAIFVLCRVSTKLLSELAPGYMLDLHLVCTPLQPPILTLFVLVTFLFWHVGMVVLSPECLAMLIVVSFVTVVVAPTIAALAVAAVTSYEASVVHVPYPAV